jgi:hypothetical protein
MLLLSCRLYRAAQIFHFPDSDAFTFAILPMGCIFVYTAIYLYSKDKKPVVQTQPGMGQQGTLLGVFYRFVIKHRSLNVLAF